MTKTASQKRRSRAVQKVQRKRRGMQPSRPRPKPAKPRQKRWDASIDASGYGLKVKGGINTGQSRQKRGLSPCSQCYALSLANPFSGPLGCIPDYPVLLTRRAKFFIKGNFQTGTQGVGWAICCPEYGAANDTPAGCVRSTSAAFAGLDLTYNAGGIVTSNTNSDYTFASFGAAAVLAEYRVVSAGLRVRYAGTELNRGGDLIALAEPNHQAVYAQTIVSIKGYVQSATVPMLRNWLEVLFKPVLNNDTSFKNVFPINTPNNTDFSYYLVIMAVAPDPLVSLNFDFEFFGNYEFSGRNIQGKQMSEFDPVGFAAVCTASISSQAFNPNMLTPQANQQVLMNDISSTLPRLSSTLN